MKNTTGQIAKNILNNIPNISNTIRRKTECDIKRFALRVPNSYNYKRNNTDTESEGGTNAIPNLNTNSNNNTMYVRSAEFAR